MSSILVLLALLSIATLFARRGYAAFVAHIVTAPILLGLGVLIAPHNLAFLTPSTSDALEPAMRVAAAWIALLVAMRSTKPSLTLLFARDTIVSLSVGVLTWLALATVCFGLLHVTALLGLGWDDVTSDLRATIGASLLIGGIISTTGLAFAQEALQGQAPRRGIRRVLFLARHDELVSALSLCAAVWLWPIAPSSAAAYDTPLLAAVIVVALGGVLAVAQLLSGGSKMGGTAASFIALVGLITFGAGLAASTRLPEAAIAFFLGAVLALAGHGQSVLEDGLGRTERPVRLVLLVLIGANLGFHPEAITLGVGLAIARLFVKAGVRAALAGGARAEFPMSALLGSAGATMPFALSFALSRPEPLVENQVLTAIAVCISVTDLLTLVFWRRATVVDVSGTNERVDAGTAAAEEAA